MGLGYRSGSLSLLVVIGLTRRVGAFPLVAPAAVVRRRRPVPVAAVVVVALAVAASAVVVVISVATSVVAVVPASAHSRFPHVDARCGRVRTLRDGVVDADAASINLHTRALVLCNFGVLLVLKVHEAKATRTSGLSINDNLYFVDGSVFREDVVDLLFCSVQTQSEHAETSRRRGIFINIAPHPVTHMAATRGHWAVAVGASIGAPRRVRATAGAGVPRAVPAPRRPRPRPRRAPIFSARCFWRGRRPRPASAMAPRHSGWLGCRLSRPVASPRTTPLSIRHFVRRDESNE